MSKRLAFSLLAGVIALFSAIASAEPHLKDVWAYDPATDKWQFLADAPDGPGVRRCHSAVYDPVTDQMLVFQGFTYGHIYTDVWAFDCQHNAWSQVTLALQDGLTTPILSAMEAIYDGVHDRVILCNSGLSVKLLDVATSSVTEAPYSNWPTELRYWSMYGFDAARNRLIVYGGGFSPQEDLWVYDFESTDTVTRWFQVPKNGTWPGLKWLTRAVVDPVRDKMIVFGGNRFAGFSGGEYSDLTYELDLNTYEWTTATVHAPPSRRGQFGACWDDVEQKEYIFGGLFRTSATDITTYDELWTYNSRLQDWVLSLSSSDPKPESRRYPTAVWDSRRRRVIVFGGEKIVPAPAIVTAAITIPDNGKHINGNRVLVKAELTSGTPDLVRDILFQYRTSATDYNDQPRTPGPWTDIPAADPDQHPNPDPTDPYFIHWDVSEFNAEKFDLHAIATETPYGISDNVPTEISVYVDSIHPDTTGTLADSHTESEHHLSAHLNNNVGTAKRDTGANAFMRLPQNSLTTDSLLTLEMLDESQPELSVLPARIGVAVRPRLQGGELLSGLDSRVTVMFDYPDSDSDGTVDGTGILASQLKVYQVDANGDASLLEDSAVEPKHNRVRATASSVDGEFIVLGTDPVNISLQKQSNPPALVVGNDVHYLLTVTNNSAIVAHHVLVTDPVPPAMTIRTATASQGLVQVNSNLVTADLGVLQPGANASLDIVVTPEQTGTIQNIAAASASEPDSHVGDNTAMCTTAVSPASGPDLSLAMSNVRLSQQRSRTSINGTLKITNVGDSDAGRSMAAIYLSDTNSIYSAHVLEPLSTTRIPSVRKGGKAQAQYRASLPAGTSVTGFFVIAVANSDHAIHDARADNNVAVSGALP